MARPPAGPARVDALLRRFPRVRIGVVGDFLADRYVQTRPARLSREAPVVILRYEGEVLGPGGAMDTFAKASREASRLLAPVNSEASRNLRRDNEWLIGHSSTPHELGGGQEQGHGL